VAKYSAGLLVYRVTHAQVLELLIVHPGGPFWARKDEGAWSIPKGEYDPSDEPEPMLVAEREFAEEIGRQAPGGERLLLGELRQPSGKRVTSWAIAGDLDVSEITSNLFEMEWPVKSGKIRSFPEVDRAAWVTAAEARTKLSKGQVPFVDRLVEQLRTAGVSSFSEGPPD
jgi:predicted NUDIX family NTP pyrophosphohydrolase